MKKKLKNACGIALVIAGAIGTVVPIIPGIPMIAAGVAMLGSDHKLVRSCQTWLQSKRILTK